MWQGWGWIGAAVLALATQSAAADLTAADFERGAPGAQALLQAAGVRCKVTAAVLVGRAAPNEGRAREANLIEIACAEDLGWVVIVAPDKPKAIDCLRTRATGQYACVLPANFSLGGSFDVLLKQAGVDCPAYAAAFISGQPQDRRVRYEVVCGDGSGLLVDVPFPRDERPARALDCLHAEAVAHCKLASRELMIARVVRLAAPVVGETCRTSDVRLIGDVPARKSALYELACGADQSGLLIELAQGGSSPRTTPCADAARYGVTCQLRGADEVSPRIRAARDLQQMLPATTTTVPEWLGKPTGEDVARVYPLQAQRQNVEGRVVILCSVTGEGRLEVCTANAEAPLGFGFGQAALKLAPKFQMALKLSDGASVEGGG
jgi:hypothetical protein